jgi:adenylate cyclase
MISGEACAKLRDMAWSVSDQRRLRTWLAAVVLGALVGYGYIFIISPWTPMSGHEPMVVEAFRGARAGMLIAALAVGLEVYGMRTALGDWLRRLSFVPAFIVREAILVAIVVVSLVLNATLSRWMEGDEPIFHYPLGALLIDAIFSFAVCGLVLFFIQMRHLIGPRTLANILLGRYHRPIKEERLFVFFDLRESTQIAAKIGDERFHALLSSVFADADREVVDHGGEVHSYIGDALIATWPLGDVKRNGRAVLAAFAIVDGLAKATAKYRRLFGVTPRFRVALHGGPVIAGECGDSKRQITYLGDVLNVAARLEQLAKTIDADFVASADMLQRLALPPDVHVLDRGEHALKGVSKPLHIISLGRNDGISGRPGVSRVANFGGRA